MNEGSWKRRVSCLPSYSQPSSSGRRCRISSFEKGISASFVVAVGLGVIVLAGIGWPSADRASRPPGGHQCLHGKRKRLQLLAAQQTREGRLRSLFSFEIVRDQQEQLVLLVVT